jgi:hypothetical protein
VSEALLVCTLELCGIVNMILRLRLRGSSFSGSSTSSDIRVLLLTMSRLCVPTHFYTKRSEYGVRGGKTYCVCRCITLFSRE